MDDYDKLTIQHRMDKFELEECPIEQLVQIILSNQTYIENLEKLCKQKGLL